MQKSVCYTGNNTRSFDKRCKAAHLREMVREFLESQFGRDGVYRNGLVVQTTLDSELQAHMENLFTKSCERLKDRFEKDIDGAVMSIEPSSGAMRVLVGGYDFKSSQFNRVLQAQRQVGSIFKPFIYLAAIENGRTFSDCVVDEPVVMQTPQGVWQPQNAYKTFDGSMSLAWALARSGNMVAIKVLLSTGIERVIALARKCGITATMHPYPSLALGCLDATVYQMTRAFNVIVNGGVRVEPYYIEWVKDQWGRKIWRHEVAQELVVSFTVSSQVMAALEATMQRYMAKLKFSGIDSACVGKTGTANDVRTCWFVGATPNLTTTIYFGCDDNRAMGKGMYAMLSALPLWLMFTKQSSVPKKQFVYDQSLERVSIDPLSGAVVDNKKEGLSILVPRRA
jgi:penicillin-binding protein 1A